jgi:hypothetical protein
MERVTGYLSADGIFFAQEDACLRYEREQLRFHTLRQRVDILMQPSTTGQEPDVRPEIKKLLECAGLWEYDSTLCSFLKEIRLMLDDRKAHDQLDAWTGIIAYLVNG